VLDDGLRTQPLCDASPGSWPPDSANNVLAKTNASLAGGMRRARRARQHRSHRAGVPTIRQIDNAFHLIIFDSGRLMKWSALTVTGPLRYKAPFMMSVHRCLLRDPQHYLGAAPSASVLLETFSVPVAIPVGIIATTSTTWLSSERIG
jgi:hypothetical protein